MSDGKPSLAEINLDEAVAPYFANVHIELISIVQAFALYMLISQNVVQVPAFAEWNWPYFLRGLTVFLLAMALWHAYVTQLAYVATLHWAHTLFPFSFGVLQFMLANPEVLKPRTDPQNLSYFVLLMSLTALTGAFAYFNTWYQHRNSRTITRFNHNFEPIGPQLHSFWGGLHIAFSAFMAFEFLLMLGLYAWANEGYKPWQEIAFPAFTCFLAAAAILIDARFCATHWAPPPIRDLYNKVYKKP